MQRLDEYREYLKSLPLPELQNTADTGYLLAFIDGDRDAMARNLHMVGENGSGYTLASDTAAYFGHATQARELAERAVAADITADVQENGAISLAVAAQWEAAYGNTGSALQLATKAMALAPTSPAAGVESALAFALAGDSSRADALAHDLTQRFPVDEQMQSIWLPAIRGQIALNRKDSGQALRALGAPSQIEAGNIQFIMVGTCLYTSYVRGNAFLAAGDGKAAAPDFRRILDRSGLVDNCWTGALARLGIARANALQAKTSTGAGADAAHVRARAAYQNFLTLWKDADPDIPIYKEAKAEYAKLQ
jgi:tetratricopeptide (TPR) repeat protein